MRKYIDQDIVSKVVDTEHIHGMRTILQYCETGECYDFILPAKFYIAIISYNLVFLSNSCVVGGKTKDDMPYFSIAGITFTMITEEEADKYRMLK